MKKRNSTSEFGKERNRFLLQAFRESIAAQSKIAIKNAFKEATEAPPPRFWVSEARAAAVLGKMLAGEDPTADMNLEKREMYQELYARFLELRELYPEASIAELTFRVVNDEAPRSYISWQRARMIIYEEKRLLKKERRGDL